MRHSLEQGGHAQGLRGLLRERGEAQVQAVLPSWAHVWPRLVLDNDRAVRYEVAEIMALLAQVRTFRIWNPNAAACPWVVRWLCWLGLNDADLMLNNFRMHVTVALLPHLSCCSHAATC